MTALIKNLIFYFFCVKTNKVKSHMPCVGLMCHYLKTVYIFDYDQEGGGGGGGGGKTSPVFVNINLCGWGVIPT
jgi:hypothetical protein